MSGKFWLRGLLVKRSTAQKQTAENKAQQPYDMQLAVTTQKRQTIEISGQPHRRMEPVQNRM